MTPSTTQIMASKRKLARTAGGFSLLLAAGIWFASRPQDLAGNVFIPNPYWIRIFGFLVIAFAGAMLFFATKKMTDSAPALIVSLAGFVDNMGGLGLGLIPWSDVAGLQAVTVMKQQFIAVQLRNSNDFMGRQTNPFKRQLMQTNLSSYGSPFILSASALECTYPELQELLSSHLAAYRATA